MIIKGLLFCSAPCQDRTDDLSLMRAARYQLCQGGKDECKISISDQESGRLAHGKEIDQQSQSDSEAAGESKNQRNTLSMVRADTSHMGIEQ